MNTFVRTGTLYAGILILGCAQAAPQTTAYVTDAQGLIVRDSYGQCVRTGDWTPSQMISGCESGGTRGQQAKSETTTPVAPPAAVTAPPVPSELPVESVLIEEHFAFNTSALPPDKRLAVLKSVREVKDSVDVQPIVVRGYADSIGSDASNKTIAARRAQTVRDLLIREGIAADKIVVENHADREAKNSGDCTRGSIQEQADCFERYRKVEVEIPVRHARR